MAEFRNTMITDNTAATLGGGVFMQDLNDGGLSTPGLFLGATLSGNSGTSGGGLYAQDSRVAAVNTTFWGNLGAPGSGLVCQEVSFADTEVALDFSNIEPAGFAALGGGTCLIGLANVFADPTFVDPAMGD